MKRVFFTPVLIMVLFLLPQITYAQMMQQGQLSLHAGASFPQGEFGATDTDDENSGFATLGLTVGGEYTYPLNTPGLGAVGSVFLMANGVNEDELLEGFDEDADISSGYWLNVPIMAGLRYETEASSEADVFALGKIGINVNRGPTLEANYDNFDATQTLSFSTATSFGFALGMGAVFNEQIVVSLRYLGLGSPEITTEVETESNGNTNTDEDDYSQPLDGIQLMIGIDI